MDTLSTRLAGLSPKKQELLARALQKKGAAFNAFPLAFQQQRMWFLALLEADDSSQNICGAVRLSGPLNQAALEQSFNEIIRRQATLRTSFPAIDGQPVQIIAPALSAALPVFDLSGHPAASREAEAARIARAEARRPFDLAQAPLLRTTLLRLGPQEHLLVTILHHIIADLHSVGVLLHEVAALYDAFAAGRPSPLPELPIQFTDYARWQRQWMQGEVLGQQLDYWKRQLAGAPELLALPADRPRPAVRSRAGASHRFAVDKRLSAALARIGQAAGATLFMTALAAFKALLYRYTGQPDLVVGTPIINRGRAETEGLIGFFLNTLALRTDLGGNPSFRELLGRVREVALGGYAHQDIPFDYLINELQPERNPAYTPLFQVLFILRNAPLPVRTSAGLTLAPAAIDNPIAHFDLMLVMEENADGIAASFEYSTDLFDAATIERMAGHYLTLLDAICADPDAPIDELALLTAAERQQLLVDWNATAVSYPGPATLHGLVERQAAASPDALALIFADQRLSYAELNARANQLARHLIGLGVGPETLVGICAERSIELVVGLLGILKAGGAYLPLDAAYPVERLGFMLADARPPVLLTAFHSAELNPELRAHLAGGDWTLVDLVGGWAAIAGEPDSNPDVAADGDNLAYMIYTSGSTGKPKGALNQHSGIRNRLLWMQAQYRLTPADRVLQKTPFSFDVAVWEFFWPLISGAALVIARPEGHKDPAYLAELIQREGVTTLHFVPSMLRLFLEDAAAADCASLRRVICSGEALPADLQERFFATLPAELHNLYGPTEAAIDVSSWACQRDSGQASVPIGRPVANTQLYILDSRLQPVPIGVAGELYIGGVQVGRGYLNRPELTAERFLRDPFSADQAARLYRTGDLARFRPDGAIEFLGRGDTQVKIRGFRIELGEIEAVLAEHPAVQTALVIDREDRHGEKFLAAYVVQASAPAAAQGEPASGDDHTVAQWQQVWETTYRDVATAEGAGDDPTFNITGWNSSYTKDAIPAEHMREWLERTVERIRAGRPARVLEMGSGTGMLMFRIAPTCREYLACDFAAPAADYLRQHAARRGLSQVRVLQRPADDFSGIPDQSFDAVVVNSVLQFFPTIDYLARVVEGAVRVTAPGGRVFIGDVRSLPLLEAFHASVQLALAPAELSQAAWAERVRLALSREEELVVDPAFFVALRQRLPRVGHVDILLKRGSQHDELTKFRYDAILHVESERPAPAAGWLDWQGEGLSLAGVRELLAGSPAELGLANVPNARLLADLELAGRQDQADAAATVAELRAALAPLAAGGVEPEALWALGAELGYTAAIGWAGAGSEASYSVLFRRGGAADDSDGAAGPALPEPAAPPRPLREYASNPLQAIFAHELAPRLRAFLASRLPDYMVPAAFVPLEAIPLTPNGKLDRQALPAPHQSRSELAAAFVAPRDELERHLVEIWEQLLDARPIGAADDFFELGGNSILAVRLMARIQQDYGVQLPLATLFQGGTIGDLAALLRERRGASASTALVGIQTEGARRPFFCIPPGGGHVMAYYNLAHRLGPDQPFYALQSVGLDGAEDPLTSFEAMAARYIRELRGIQPEGPYLIGGWCTGGRIATEVARQLTAQGQEVALLALLDATPILNHLPLDIETADDASLLGTMSPALHAIEQALPAMPAAERLAALVEQGRAAGLLPADVDLRYILMILRVYRANLRAERRFVPADYPGRAVLFRAARQPEGALPDLGWGVFIKPGLEVADIPGDHFSMFEDTDDVQALAERLNAYLAQAAGQ
jgi:amino acid adenylation domain-containing protein